MTNKWKRHSINRMLKLVIFFFFFFGFLICICSGLWLDCKNELWVQRHLKNFYTRIQMHLVFAKVRANIEWECIMTLTFSEPLLYYVVYLCHIIQNIKIVKRAASKRFTKNLFAEVVVEGGETDTVLHIHNT